MEGTWLDQDCGGKFSVDGYQWGHDISLSYIADGHVDPPPPLPDGFHWDASLLIEKLKEVQKTTLLRVDLRNTYSDSWAAVYGRFETQEHFQTVRYPSGQRRDIGYGHMNGSPAQLIGPRDGFYDFDHKPRQKQNQGLELWNMLKQQFKTPDSVYLDAREYFDATMKGALTPFFRGTVLNSSPVSRPQSIVVSISGDGPDATLKLDRPLKHAIRSGTKVDFQGVATDFVQDPFMMMFDVSVKNLVVNPTGPPKDIFP